MSTSALEKLTQGKRMGSTGLKREGLQLWNMMPEKWQRPNKSEAVG